ncbi:hypothetical protein E0485_01180 [Paenibacillus albiflavus]|uniref:Uncharacterized protein n=1 Tax=Paenibacillus albiflavus TaxID=2545760 RepID=A0A4R4ELN0_9BACL|nr:hypothetical protein [Paenibacillus albiflavus]TCZ80929.1 hypothetical protein E0485_01180 [Paenibacillus albiflavus]
MMRYWKTTAFIAVMVLSIGVYYIGADGPKPDYYIQTLSGDKQEAANIIVDGRYKSDPISIDLGGSSYESGSFFRSLDRLAYDSPTLNQLAQDHSSFLRGIRGIDNFTENEQMIGHVGLDIRSTENPGDQKLIFKVSLYDKESKDNSSFQVIVPKKIRGGNGYCGIDYVWLEAQAINVITWEPYKSSYELHLYRFSLDQKSLLQDKIMNPDEMEDTNLGLLIGGRYEQDSLKHNRNVIFQRYFYDNNDTKTVSHKELVAYDLNNDKLEQIENDQLNEMLSSNMDSELYSALTGDVITLTKVIGNHDLQIVRYQIAEKKMLGEFTLSLKDLRLTVGGIYSVTVKDDRAYVLGSSNTTGFTQMPVVNAIDLNTGKIVYQGSIQAKSDEAIKTSLSLYKISFKL